MIEVGQSVTLELWKREQKEPDRYRCKIVDFEDEHVYIDYPVNLATGRTDFFLEGIQFNASFLGRNQSVYTFPTEVAARKKLKIPVLMLTYPGEDELIRIQRRKYVRIERAADIAIQHAEDLFPPFTSVTLDISGGGVAVLLPLNHTVERDQSIKITLVLGTNAGEEKYIFVSGKIVRVVANYHSNRDKASVEFIDISDSDRQTIIQYCFEQQMNQKKQGM
ncbi:flagellar brake protein [Thalassobacillus sp. CUG 92003]|uniref:flagellar brake protein n=1 Tax=Thalassobacillus sp. CUG 92003 TaxID=2736641 RepID=UPI0015E72E83|nr:flagellar brake domain-containing protein [Thalassobacillus sp. CUG 92003]